MNKNRPVVLLHGIDDKAHSLRFFARHLKKAGFETYEFEYAPSNGQLKVEELGSRLELFLKEHGLKHFDMVGFSMGGMAARYYVQEMGGYKHVKKLITVSSPHHGTWLGYLRRLPAAHQLRPGSDFLKKLNGDGMKRLKKVEFTSIYSPLDLMIVPATSSRMPMAENLKVWVLLHPFMLWDKKVLRILVERLSE